MILSRKWLSEFVEIDASDRAFAEAMTLSGSKVERTADLGAEIKNVVVGKVLSIERHPDSDHMFVCMVDAGRGAPRQIVTGAQNVSKGDLVPVALDGASLPGGVTISRGTLRGVVSDGMLCSLAELGLTRHNFPYAVEDGILILKEDCRPGDDIRPVTGLDDHAVEFEITNNRPDCFSVIGLAREAAATFRAPLRLHEPVVQGEGGDIRDLLRVEVRDPDLCPRYTARMVKNVRVAPSPKWLRERLFSSGVRPINNIVDITNYVMLEYGQPMHAFDYEYVQGGAIIVRRAGADRAITTLDGAVRKLSPDMLVIADGTRPVGLAGVMGGENSEITDGTTRIVFESANFSGVSIRRTALALGLRTDASSRFEKGLDARNTLPAVQRACELVELLGAGEVVGGIIDVDASSAAPFTLPLAPEKINRLLGLSLTPGEMAACLAPLGFALDGGTVTVPSWRADVRHYSDVAEEVARMYGYARIPTTLMRGETTQGGYSDRQRAEALVGSLCRGMGYSEILTYSFVSPSCFDKIRLPADAPLRKALTILNPLGEDTSILRTTALPSMLEMLGRNFSYRNKTARLFELATVYLPNGGDLADERTVLSLGGYGGGMDFFALKGAVEAVLAALRIENAAWEAEPGNPSYHPGRCARIVVSGQTVGVLGQVHPLAEANYGVGAPCCAAQLDLPLLLSLRTPEKLYEPLPRFPSVSRDIAVVCGADIPVARLEDCIARGAKGLLREIALFDVYTGPGVPAGKKSAAFSLTLRADDRTLSAAEADEDVGSVLALLERELGAVLR